MIDTVTSTTTRYGYLHNTIQLLLQHHTTQLFLQTHTIQLPQQQHTKELQCTECKLSSNNTRYIQINCVPFMILYMVLLYNAVKIL